MIPLAAAVFGAIVGSFLNVCIERLPHRRSLVFPGSHCPRCGTPIRPYDNIPILSYLWLRGACRACGGRISLRYPLVELLGMASALACVWMDAPWPQRLVAFGFLCALIVITFIDIDYQIIPDVISLPGIVVGLAASFLPGPPTVTEALIGAAAGGGFLWIVAEGYFRLTGREGMGGGDVKLLAMMGAFLGWRALPVILFVGSLTGTIVGVTLIVARGRDARVPIPFGPFLALGAVCALFWGDAILAWYLSLGRPL